MLSPLHEEAPMHAFVIAVEGYIDTIRSLFTDTPLIGFTMLGILLGGVAIVVWVPARQERTRPVRSQGHELTGEAALYAQRSKHHHSMDDESIGPTINTNGMPMIPGTSIDIEGNLYGSS
jgi:hypothetical protein